LFHEGLSIVLFKDDRAVPLTWSLDPNRNFADVRGVGTVTLPEAIRAIRELAASFAHHHCGCLVDVRDMDFYPTVAELKELAFEYIRLRAAFRCGTSFIVSNDRHYSLGRLLAALVDVAGLRMAVFRDPDEAEAWLRKQSDPSQATA
jgi:hypothetical protein